MAESKAFKSLFGRFSTYVLDEEGKKKRIAFQYNEYQTDDPQIIKGLMGNQYYGVFFSLKKEFPINFPSYVSKSKMDTDNAAIVKDVLSENEDLKAELERLKAKKTESDEIKPKPGPKKKG